MSKHQKHNSRRLARKARNSSPRSADTGFHQQLPSDQRSVAVPALVVGPDAVSGHPRWARLGVVMILVAIIVAGAGLYHRTLHHDIVLDDQSYVMNNPFLTSASSFLYPLDFARFANSAARRGVDPDIAVNFITRPVTYATFYWNRLAGGIDPSGYRIINITIHIVSGLLIFVLATQLSRGGAECGSRSSLLVPSLAALLFEVHPLATESVTYITQRFESLATMFYLGGLCLFLAGQSTTRFLAGWLLRTMAVGAFICGMLSKETGFTAPLMLLIVTLLCIEKPWRESLKAAAPTLALLPLVPLLVLAASWAQSGRDFSFWSSLNITNVGPEWIAPQHYFLTQVCASLSYLRLILLPVGQNFDPDYPLITSPLDVRFIGSVIGIAALLAGAWWCHRRWGRPHGSLVLAGVVWFFVTLAPSSSIIPLPDLFAEHRSYLPSAGIFLAIGALAGRASEWIVGSKSLVWLRAACALWIGALSAATVARNQVLRDDESIYRDALAKSPGKARVWNGLGCSLAYAGKLEESLSHFAKAAELQPTLINAWKNASTIHMMLGKYSASLEAAEEGLRRDSLNPNLQVNRGVALAALGRFGDSEGALKAALEVSPKLREAHLCLARLYAGTGERSHALDHFRIAASSGPLIEADAKLLAEIEQLAADDKRNVAAGM